jgi:battenin
MGNKKSSYDKVDDDARSNLGEAKVRPEKIRNLAAFFICGLMNNFAYVVFLSAATDLLENGTTDPLPTSAVLLADILPGLIAQGIAPFFMHVIPYGARVVFITITASASFVITALFANVWIKLIGVVVASISCGFGEITYMALSSYFHKNTVSSYSSGTGAAGIGGSLIYLAARDWIHLSSEITLWICCPLPILMIISYFFIMERYDKRKERAEREKLIRGEVEDTPVNQNTEKAPLTFAMKLKLQGALLKYTGPLFLVYFAEYLINQGVTKALQFPKDLYFFTDNRDYRYYALLYQIGVFISRSSVNFFPIKRLYIVATLQVVNLGFLWAVAYWNFIPNIWILFPIIVWEGLIGGSIYVNAFYLISSEIDDAYKEFCLSSVSFWYACGILGSAFAGLALQPWLIDRRNQLYFVPLIKKSA